MFLSSLNPKSDLNQQSESTLEHGIVRADQGFDPGEIAREHRLLRSIIFEVIETELLQASAVELLRAVRFIDPVFRNRLLDRIASPHFVQKLTAKSSPEKRSTPG